MAPWDNEDLERRRRAREQHEEQEKASMRLDKSNRKMKMSAVWKQLPIELTSMIIAQNALLPLDLCGYTTSIRYPEGIQYHQRIQAVDPEKWHEVRTTLQICKTIRAKIIHTLNTHGAIEHVRIAHSSAGPRGQRFEPSWWLLRHFRWVFINRDLWSMARGDAAIGIFVTMPIPGAMRNVERIEHVRADNHRGRSDDELEEQMAFWCYVAADASSWMFLTVGGWLMHHVARDGSDVRRLISRAA